MRCGFVPLAACAGDGSDRQTRSGKGFRAAYLTAILLALLATGLAAVAAPMGIRVIPLTPGEAAPAATNVAPFAPRNAASGAVAERLQQALNTVRARRAALGAQMPPGSAAPTAGTLRALLGAATAPATRPAPLATPGPGRQLEVHMRGIGTPRLIRGTLQPDGRRLPLQAAITALRAASSQDDAATARRFLAAFRDYLRLDDPDQELEFAREIADELGYRHLRFGQKYRNLPVWPAGLTVHMDGDGQIASVSGAYVPTPRTLDPKPKLDAGRARAITRALWADGSGRLDGPDLIVYGAVDSAPRLAWKLKLVRSLRERWTVVVDAQDGTVLSRFNEVEEVAATGSGVDLFGASRALNLWLEGGTYYLTDTSKAMFDAARSNPPQARTTRGAIIVQDARNQPPTSNPQTLPSTVVVSSGNANRGWLADGVSAASGFAQTYDYYQTRHGRNSIDGAGGNILGVVRLGSGFDNAFWASDLGTMFFGDAQPFAGALDVVAHELTHGVTSYTANLVYQGQSGALNEAFSDIFGEMVEYYAEGSNDWLMGSRLSEPVRNMKDPSALLLSSGVPYPSKMSDYVRTTQDNGGVHINSGIINRAYYLLAEGLDQAIGRADAERIFYRALAFHLTQNAQFADARLACIQSAEELFGAGSAQAQRVAEAFDGVEIPNPTTPSGDPGTAPTVSGNDAVLFVYFDSARGGYMLGRREPAQGDDASGTVMSPGSVQPARPSVSANGKLGIYVDGLQDACLIDTKVPINGEECLGLFNVHSVAMAPDGEIFAFVMLNPDGSPSNEILTIDTRKNTRASYKLVAPGTEGVNISSVVQADVMAFTSNDRFLIYDALNAIAQEDGTEVRAWSVYAIDLVTGQTLILVPPVLGRDIGNPALGNLSDDLLTFEAQDSESGKSTVLATRLSTGETGTIAETVGTASPVFSGDDSAIVFSAGESADALRSLYRQALGSNRVTPAGSAELWLANADFGAVYRRSARFKLTVKTSGAGAGRVLSQPSGIDCGNSCVGLYPKGARLRLTASPDLGSKFAGWRGACSGKRACTLKMGQARTVRAVFQIQKYRELVVSKTGTGTGAVFSNPTGIDCGAQCSAPFLLGSTVRLSAVPEPGSRFLGWRGACGGKGVCRVKLSKARKVSARFEPAG